MSKITCVVILFLLMTLRYAPAQEITDYDSLLSEMSKSWEHIQDQYFQGIRVSEDTVIKQSECRTHFHSDMILKDGMDLCESIQTDAEEQDTPTLFSNNPKYSFELKKIDDRWVIQDVSLVLRKDNKDFLSTTCELLSPIMILDVFLKDLVKEPGFEILSMEKNTIEEKEYITLNFRRRSVVNNTNRLQEGFVVLDPSLQWAVHSYHYVHQVDERSPRTGEMSHETITYDYLYKYRLLNGVPVLETLELTTDPAASNTLFTRARKVNVTYKSVEFTTVPDDLFYLKHYGLSEPDLPKPIGHTTRYTVLFLGILLIVLGIYLRRRASQA